MKLRQICTTGLFCAGTQLYVKKIISKVSYLLIVEIVDALFSLSVFYDASIFLCRISQLQVEFSDYFLILFVTEIALKYGWLVMTPKTTNPQRVRFGVFQPHYEFFGIPILCTLGRTSIDCSYIKCEIICVLKLNSANHFHKYR